MLLTFDSSLRKVDYWKNGISRVGLQVLGLGEYNALDGLEETWREIVLYFDEV